jgi:hypothetical protein
MASEIHRFFRHCPACGRRFEISLVSKSLVRETVTNGEEESPSPTAMQDQVAPSSTPIRSSSFTSIYPGGYSILNEEKQPIVIDTKEFQYSYRCHHCGHMWSEHRVQEKSRPIG